MPLGPGSEITWSFGGCTTGTAPLSHKTLANSGSYAKGFPGATTLAALIDKINQVVNQLQSDPEMLTKMTALGFQPDPKPAAVFDKYIRATGGRAAWVSKQFERDRIEGRSLDDTRVLLRATVTTTPSAVVAWVDAAKVKREALVDALKKMRVEVPEQP